MFTSRLSFKVRPLLALFATAATLSFAQSEKPSMSSSKPSGASTFVYVGTYTGKGSDGILRFRLEGDRLTSDGLAAPITNPSFLALSPDRKHLYCCNEIGDFQGKKSGAATSFEITPETGALRELDQAPSGGEGPCYVSVAPDNAGVFVANYGSGDVSSIPTEPNRQLVQQPSAVAHHEGKSVVPKRQDAPHAHCVRPDPTGNWAIAVDLGIDQLIAYPVEKGTLNTSAAVSSKTRPGAGPRHIAFHPNGKLAFVSNELDATISAYNWEAAQGTLTEYQHLTTLPADPETTKPAYPGEVLVHPDGRFVYLTNREGDNTIAIYQVDETSGKLTLVGHERTRGIHPRGMNISPDGTHLIAANQKSDTLQLFAINKETGLLTHLQQVEGISQPAHVLFY